MRLYRSICWAQGLYCLISGSWPLVSIETFQMVTGPKTDHLVTGRESDHWLVNTVAALVVANGIVFIFSAWRGRFAAETAVLGITSAMALARIDIVYHSRGTIPAVYLGDAVLEIGFIVAWLVCLAMSPKANRL